MKITISVPGRFHAFYLASYLDKRNSLSQLLTTYPRFEAAKYQIAKEQITSFVELELFSRAVAKVPRKLRLGWNPQYLLAKSFDQWASRHLKATSDLFVGFSGASLASLDRARDLGMRTLLERHSCHMLTQQELLTEEYAKAGRPFSETHPGVIFQELCEYEKADFLSVPSHFVRESFLRFGIPSEKILVLPLGVDLAQFSPAPDEKSPSHPFRVICCGSVTLQKGTRYLLEAFHALALPSAELWIVGVVTPEMQAIAQRYASPQIRFFGHQKQSELARLYRQCDLACAPSIQDGFAVVVPQAMACGLPVLCSENTGAKDLIEEGRTGFVVPIRSVSALKEKIEWSYAHRSEVKEMGKLAREKVSTGFSWADYGDRMWRAFEKILASSSPERNLAA